MDPDPPRTTEAEPIACAACHDPHDGRRPHQLRLHGDVVLASGAHLDHAGAGAVCAACHQSAPDAPAGPLEADLLAGMAAGVAATSVHASLRDSCVACHRPHRFAADRRCDATACATAGCHAAGGCGTALRDAVLAALAARPAKERTGAAAAIQQALQHDRSHGAHNPAWAREALRRLR